MRRWCGHCVMVRVLGFIFEILDHIFFKGAYFDVPLF